MFGCLGGQDLVYLLGVELDVLPVCDGVAEGSPDAAAVLAEGAEDVEVGLGCSLAEEFHSVGDLELGGLGGFDLVVCRVEEGGGGEDDG